VVALLAVGIVATAVLAWLLVVPWWRGRQRSARMATPLPTHLRAIIERNVPAARLLPALLRERLEALVGAFIAEKEFVGCNGLVVTDEIRVTIAALAGLLVIGRRGHYDELQSILVYPTAFWVEDEVEDEAGVVGHRRRILSGEAWQSSRIVLSWEDVTEARDFPGEGYNVALHEFAHYLDAEGLGLAAPPQTSTPAGTGRVRPLEAWGRDLAAEFERHLDSVDRGEDTLLDPYAADDESEFFAVATEEFLERPSQLLAGHPRLYALLQEFYALDPAAWTRASHAGAP
jgi:Mlc titration factor MtfA (ptsG expression regulator)